MRLRGTAASPGDAAVRAWIGHVRNVGGRLAFVVVGIVLVTATVLASGAGAAGNRVVTVYSVATGVQYINTEDDRVRGRINHPLDPAAEKLTPKRVAKKSKIDRWW